MKAIDYLFLRPLATLICLVLLAIFIFSTLGCTHDEMIIMQDRANQEMDTLHEKVEKARSDAAITILKEMVNDEHEE